jgi:hypothetical protein
MVMSPTLRCERAPHLALRMRSRSLRRRAQAALERAAALRRRSELLRGSAPRMNAEAREDAEARQWYRVQVREMLAAGWGRAELADVGITDALLQELGLTPFAAE